MSVGSVSMATVTTVAPTMPVEAPMSTPTSTMAMPMPPLSPPMARPMVSSMSCATLDFSSMTPMNTNSGMASMV